MISFPAWGGIWEERPQAATAPPSRTFVLEGRLQVDVQGQSCLWSGFGRTRRVRFPPRALNENMDPTDRLGP